MFFSQWILLLSLSLHYAWGSSKKCELVIGGSSAFTLLTQNTSGPNGSETVRVVLGGGGVHGEVRVGEGEQLAHRSGRKEFVFRVQVALSRRRKSAAQCNSNSVKPPTNR